MSALRLTSSTSTFAGSAPLREKFDWISIDTAAKRSGLHRGYLATRCRQMWQPRGLARLQHPNQGGKPVWHIRVDADPAFAAVKFPEQIEFDVRSLTESQRIELFSRKRIIDRWQEVLSAGSSSLGFTRAQITEQFLQHLELDEGRKVSPATLYNWYSAWRTEGLGGLCDRRSQRASTGSADSGFHACLKEYFLSTSKPSKTAAYVAATFKAKEQGWEVVGKRAACLYLQSIEKSTLVRRREGEDAMTAKCEASIERDYSTLHTNEIWVGDHHQMDVIVDSQGQLTRPWLTAWMDMRSRRIVGWVITAHAPNTNSILSALRSGILDCGIPELLYVDNGKDYGSYVLHGSTKQQRRHRSANMPKDTRWSTAIAPIAGICNHLQIKVKFCQPYHGQSKPIERFFGTLESQFGKSWPTYRGNSPENRPEESEKRLAAGEAPPLADFIQQFQSWLENNYHKTSHAGDGMEGKSPLEIYEQKWNGFSKRTAGRGLLDLLLLKQPKPLKVHKNGVTWQGISYGQYCPELIPLLGKEVYLRIDERDITRVQVWSMQDQFICAAPANKRLPANANEQELRDAIAEKRSHRRLQREYHQKRPHLVEDLTDTLIQARSQLTPREQTRGDSPPPDRPNIRPIRSPLEDQLDAVQRGVELVSMRPTGTDDAAALPERFHFNLRPGTDEDDADE